MDLAHDSEADNFALMRISDRLSDPRLADYFAGNAHRIATFRALVEVLDLPLPDWAERGVGGRTNATKEALNRFRQDYPDEALPRGYVPPIPR